jgi:hypothetical protein
MPANGLRKPANNRHAEEERIGGAIANAGAEQVRRCRSGTWVFMSVEKSSKAGRDMERIQKAAPSLAFVPSSQSPGIAVFVSNSRGCKY